MPLPDHVQLRDVARFAAVVEAGGFTAAARILGESTKQVSRRIARLEAELGVRLLHRTTRSVHPTPEGREWYGAARQALDALEGASERLRPSQTEGRVRVQVPTLFVDMVIDWLGELMEHHPGLHIDLLVGDLADDMLALGLDVALTAVPPSNAGVLLKRLGAAAPLLAAHPDYLARHGTPSEPRALAAHECLRFYSDRGQSEWPLLHDDGTLERVPVGGRLASNDSRTLLRALESGMGIGPLLGTDWGELVRVLPGWRMAGIDMFLAVAPGRRRVARVRTVVNGLEAIARDPLAAARLES